MGIDKVGIDKVGIDKVGIDKVGRYRPQAQRFRLVSPDPHKEEGKKFQYVQAQA